MTDHSDNGQRETSVVDQMTFIGVVNTGSLPFRAMNSVRPSNTLNLQVVQVNNPDIRKFTAILLEQRAPPMHVNF